MNQEFAAPVIQQPESPQERKKHFCFATIPFIFILLIGLYQIIRQTVFIISSEGEFWGNPDANMLTSCRLLYLSSHLFVFAGAVFIITLLFAKQNNSLLSVPLFIFSSSYLLYIGAQILDSYYIYNFWQFYESYPTFFEFFKEYIPFIVSAILTSLGFLAVMIYTFIVTSRKKPAPKVLWIIPAIIFSLFTLSLIVYRIVEFFARIYNIIKSWEYQSWHNVADLIKFTPDYFIEIPFIIAIILLLIWLSFPYKKNKSKKSDEIQTVPTDAPIMPEAENKPEDTPVLKPVDEAEKTVEPELKPAVKPVTPPPVQPQFSRPVPPPQFNRIPVPQPPVNATPIKPSIDDDAEKQRTNIQLLKEYKDLLDGGLITQEDYDQKKKRLLDLQ